MRAKKILKIEKIRKQGRKKISFNMTEDLRKNNIIEDRLNR
jgi:hypothetical protein